LVLNPRIHKIKISKSLQVRIRKGFPWVYFYQIKNTGISGQPGDLGAIYDSQNRFLAMGLYDPHSDIRLRILITRTPQEITGEFFRHRLKKALALRADLATPETTAYRVVNGENDGFPGMVMDRYADTLVVKLYTSAWMPYLDELVPVLQQEMKLERAILTFSRHVQRTLPDPKEASRMLFGPELEGPIRFQENGLEFEADLLKGQKTGFFLDQRENREKIRGLAQGQSILNVFSYTGAFSVYAFAGGCRSVLEIDINAPAQKAALRNLRLNFPEEKFSPPRFEQIQGDAFEQLSRLEKDGKVFDLVVLDPPAFANSKKNRKNAIQAYIRLAKMGAKSTRAGGTLMAASCSSQVEAQAFYRAVELGIKAAGRSYKKLLKTGHALDHPVTFREGAYLKAIYCKIES